MSTIRSLADVAAVAFIAIVVVPRAAIPLVDGDIWWHLRAGETVLDTGRVPVTDTWTIAGQGMPWISQDWLTNTAIAAAMRVGGAWGPTLISLLFALIVGAAFAVLWRAAGKRSPRPRWLARVAWLTLGLIVAGPVIGPRVQTIDLLMAAVTAWVLWGYLADHGLRWLVALPAISLAWVNLHAGWPLLIALTGAAIVGEAGDRLGSRRLARNPSTWPQIARLAIAGGAALLVVVANPNGVAMYGYPFATAGIAAHRDFLFEWSAPDLGSFPGRMILVLVCLAVVPTLAIARRTMPLSDALWLIGLAGMSLTAVRFALLAGPICATIAAVHLSPWVARRTSATGMGRLAGRLERTPSGGRGRANAVLAAIVVAAGIGLALSRVAPAVQSAAIVEAMPERAATWLRNDGASARIFNVYAWGGYLGRELPEALVYIDGRSDIYGDAPIRAYARAISLETDPGPLLDAAAIDTVVFWPDSALAMWLDDHGWERVHTDELAAVWRRAGAAP